MVKQISADVVIIGGGVIGTLTARELSRYSLDVWLVEKEAEVGWGATKANSGIVHAGFHDKPGSAKAKYCVAGNALYPELCRDLDVSFEQNGILMVARSPEEEAVLETYKEQGEANGVPGLRIIGQDELRQMEPNLSPSITAGLLAPSGGTVAPFELAAAAMENAVKNGAQLLTESPVEAVHQENDRFVVTTPSAQLKARFIVNAAGLHSDTIARLFGDTSFAITPRKGEEYLFDKSIRVVSHTIFPVPNAISKGILVIPTSEGNVMIGPTGDNIDEREDITTTQHGFSRIFESAQELVPSLSPSGIITQFAGIRAACDRGDFVIGYSPVSQQVIHLAGVESPGLTAAPAIAQDCVRLLAQAGLDLLPNSSYCPQRRPVVRFHRLSRTEQAELVTDNPAYGRIICRCETVTEAEIVDAIRRGARTIDGVKFRVRAGAGRCQGGFCQPLVMQILARELGIPLTAVTKRGRGSEQVRYTSKELVGRQTHENIVS